MNELQIHTNDPLNQKVWECVDISPLFTHPHTDPVNAYYSVGHKMLVGLPYLCSSAAVYHNWRF